MGDTLHIIYHELPAQAPAAAVKPASRSHMSYSDRTWIGIISGLTVCFTVAGWTIVHGCQTPSTSVPDQRPTLESIERTAKDVSIDVPARAGRIDQHADAIAARAGPQAKLFGPFLGGIHTETQGLREDAAKLSVVPAQAIAVAEQVDRLQDANAALTKDKASLAAANEKLKADHHSLVEWALFVAALLGLGGVGFAVYLFVEGNIGGAIPIAVASAGVVVASIVLQVTIDIAERYAGWLLGGMGLVVAGGIAYAIYAIRTYKVSTTQVVKTNEAAKQKLRAADPAAAQQVFGDGAVPGSIADDTQSPTTQKIVAAIRSAPTFRPAKTTATTNPVVPATAPTA